ncbi:MAG: alpha-amylase family glycosyl hydrolase [Pirellulales bacterium]
MPTSSTPPLNPALYQINTRVRLTELTQTLGRRATLDDITDVELDQIAAQGFDWVWFLSVWRTGVAGRAVSRGHSGWRQEFEETLHDLVDDDIAGSGFAVTDYEVGDELGGDAALARLRERMRRRGLKLMLDFVPNHMGLDHPWVEDHPEYFIAGTEEELENAPQNFVRLDTERGEKIFAYGRDPYFSGWPDTLQLDYSNPATQAAMLQELSGISTKCDGVHCDMAMLILPDVFHRTWWRTALPFWPNAIEQVRRRFPDFLFLAEVYWDMEWTLQQQGFDYAYDKRLYDRLHAGNARPVRDHLRAELNYQSKLVRFLENHDEPRSALTFPLEIHKAAATITYLARECGFFSAASSKVA